MTPEKAIIVLDKLNTTERIKVDPGELKEAVKTAKAALRKQIPYPALGACNCSKCLMLLLIDADFCPECGQAIDWS